MNNLKYTTLLRSNKFNPHFLTGFCDAFTSINTKCNGIILIYPTYLAPRILNFIPFLDSILILEKFYLNNKKSARCLFTSSSNKNLSLVVWGTNLTSQVGTGRFIKQVSDMIALPSYQKSVIIGLLLSDGWLTIPVKNRKNARLGFKQSVSRATYLWFVFNRLSHYCSSYPQLTQGTRVDKILYGLQFLLVYYLVLLNYILYSMLIK